MAFLVLGYNLRASAQSILSIWFLEVNALNFVILSKNNIFSACSFIWIPTSLPLLEAQEGIG